MAIETIVLDDSGWPFGPQVCGQYITWQSNFGIWLFDLKTGEKKLIEGPTGSWKFGINHTGIFSRQSDLKTKDLIIWFYHFESQEKREVFRFSASQPRPIMMTVSDQYLGWTEQIGSTWADNPIRYKLLNLQTKEIIDLGAGPTKVATLDLWNNWVALTRRVTDPTSPDYKTLVIMAYFLPTGQSIKVSFPSRGSGYWPVIWGDNIVWEFGIEPDSPSHFRAIGLANITTGLSGPAFADNQNNYNPDIWGDMVVFARDPYNRGYFGQIWLNQISTGRLIQVSDGQLGSYPNIYGNIVVWTLRIPGPYADPLGYKVMASRIKNATPYMVISKTGQLVKLIRSSHLGWFERIFLAYQCQQLTYSVIYHRYDQAARELSYVQNLLTYLHARGKMPDTEFWYSQSLTSQIGELLEVLQLNL